MTRYFFYSHDTYGLGHLRRSLLLAEAIVQADPNDEVLIATGSPQAQAFSMPDRIDSLKLPSATKDRRGAYQPRKLAGSIDELVALRSAVVTAAVASYAPEVIVVDHAPLGMAGELIPLLERFAGKANGPRMVLGLRDIIDDADRVDTSWRQSGVWGALGYYDDIFVYGDPRILTTARELELGSRVDASVRYTGYVAPTMPDPGSEDEPFLLVTPGGGGDGQVLLRRYLSAVEAGATDGLKSVVVTGPLLSSSRREEAYALAARLPSVEILEFTDHMRSLIASAAGVISMAGYNTVVEELACGVPALLVPRNQPRLEQTIRARRLAPHTRLQNCPIDNFGVDAIRDFVRNRDDSIQPQLSIDLTGAATVAKILAEPHLGRTSFADVDLSTSTPIGALR